MSKTNKELAVELAIAWLQGFATVASGPNVRGANFPDVPKVMDAIKHAKEKLDEMD